MVAAVFVQQGDDGLDVALLDDVQSLMALHQDAVQDLQDACRAPGTGYTKGWIHALYLTIIRRKESHRRLRG